MLSREAASLNVEVYTDPGCGLILKNFMDPSKLYDMDFQPDPETWPKSYLDNFAVLVGQPAGSHEYGGGDVRVSWPDVVQHRLPGQRVEPLLLRDHLLVVLLAVGGRQVHHFQQACRWLVQRLRLKSTVGFVKRNKLVHNCHVMTCLSRHLYIAMLWHACQAVM